MFQDLSVLVQAGRLEEIKEFVQQKKTEGSWHKICNDDSVLDAFRDAILLKQEETVRFFLSSIKWSNIQGLRDKENPKKRPSVMYFACISGHLPIVKLIVTAIIKQRLWDKDDARKDIITAFTANHPDIVGYLIEMGNNPNFVTIGPKRQPILFKSAQDNNVLMIETLLSHKADIELALNWVRNEHRVKPVPKQENPKSKSKMIYELLKKKVIRKHKDKKIEGASNNNNENVRESDNLDNELNSSHKNAIKILLDYAIGMDFMSLDFLNDLDVSGFNFLGISVNGQPVTREILIAFGAKGAEKAIVTFNDLVNVESPRREILLARLEQCFAKRGRSISNKGIINLVPLWSAAECGDIETVKIRLIAGVDPNASGEEREYFHEEKKYPIVLAAANGHFPVVQELAKNPRSHKALNVKAVVEARDNNHDDIVAYLLSQFDINTIDDDGETLLHYAIQEGDLSWVALLIELGADINLQNRAGETPLEKAAFLCNQYESSDERLRRLFKPREYLAIVELLIAKGADAKPYKNHSPLLSMVQAGHVKLVEQLLPLIDKSRASVARDSDNQVIYRDYWYVEPMFSALRTDNVVEILSLLKKFGADFNHIGGKGSLLINAIYLLLDGFEKEKLKVIYFLIRNGADLSVIDGRNNSIIDILEQNVGECPSAFKDEYNKLLDFVRSSIECETPLVVSEDKQETTSDSHNKKVMSELMRQRAKLYKPTEFLNVFSHKEEVINDISFHNSLNA